LTAYYNEFDPKAAAWLRELISDGLIAQGEVNERSIIEVHPNDLTDFEQCHFFAGIGGWSYALRLAQYPDNKPVWTASLPCQPFSTAGKGLGKKDERHLLPHFLELVAKCKPDTIFGEQVERAIGHGWLDDLQATMEAEGYAVGHCVLGAHSIGAAHIRQRLYWVADYCGERLEKQSSERGISSDKNGDGARQNTPGSGWMAHDSKQRALRESSEQCKETGRQKGYNVHQSIRRSEVYDWLYCRDGKYRPIESGLKPLVDGVPRGMVHSSDPRNTQEARAIRLKGYGNAIVPQLASEFISAFMETTQ